MAEGNAHNNDTTIDLSICFNKFVFAPFFKYPHISIPKKGAQVNFIM